MADKEEVTTTADNSAGRVVHRGGKAVWRWAREKIDSTSILLKRLDNSSLKLQEDCAGAVDPDGSAELSLTDEARASGGGFDPYNTGS